MMKKKALSLLIAFTLVLGIFSGVMPMLSSAIEATDKVYLSDINYGETSYTSFESIKKNLSVESRPIKLYNGSEYVTYSRGYGLNATGQLVFDLTSYTAQGYNYFEGIVGVNEDATTKGSVAFSAYVDGILVFSTDTMYRNTPAAKMQIDISNAKELRLYANDCGDQAFDHADFADLFIGKANDIPADWLSMSTAVDKPWIAVGGTAQLSSSGSLSNRKTIDLDTNGTVLYTSSATGVATVSSTGKVTGISAGETVITAVATYGGEQKTTTTRVVVGGTTWSVKSPDEKVVTTLILAGGYLRYFTNYDGKEAIGLSDLGITSSLGDFTSGLVFVSQSSEDVTQSYDMISGKAATYTDNSKQTTFKFSKSGATAQLSVIVRASDDSVSFRYVIDNGSTSGTITVSGESSSFKVPAKSLVGTQNYSHNYENKYGMTTIEALKGNQSLTLIYQTPAGVNVMLSEANMGTGYCGTMLKPDGTGILDCDFSPDQSGSVSQTGTKFTTPWRVAVIGSLAKISETMVFENLSEENKVADAESWVVPGVTGWTWMAPSPGGGANQNPALFKEFIDGAAEMGWKYLLMDDGWWSPWNGSSLNPLPDWLPDLVEYANERGVELLAWMNHSNVNTEAKINAVFKRISDAGIKGLKIDFFDNESQNMMKLFDLLSVKSAEYKLMVNFHGANKPTGERRTYPQVLTREAVYGNEIPGGVTAPHNVLIGFTRAVVGPTDYTPMITNNNFTTNQEAALAVAYESGIPCFASSPDEYRASALYSWYKNMPSAWDETVGLGGKLGDSFSIARRSGDLWYASTICVSKQDAVFNLDFLDDDTNYTAVIYKDTADRNKAEIELKTVRKGDTLTIPMSANGAANIKFYKASNETVTLSLDKTELTLEKGTKDTITATVTPAEAEYCTVKWTSSNEDAVTVSGKNVAELTAKSTGASLITATVDTGNGIVTKVCLVTVNATVGTTLSSGWTMLKEDTSRYALDPTAANKMTITVTAGDLYNEPPPYTNMLLRAPGSADFTITTKLNFSPTTDYHSAGLMVYVSDTAMYSVQRRYHSALGNNIIGSVNNNSGSKSEVSVPDSAVGSDIYLKITKTGATLTSYWSTNGTAWTQVSSVTNASITGDIKVGLYTGKGGNSPAAAEIPATFTDFTLNDQVIPFSTVTAGVTTADYSGVAAAIESVPADLTIYTDESVSAIEAAIKAVNWNVVAANQTSVDNMEKAITDAIEGLERIPDVEENIITSTVYTVDQTNRIVKKVSSKSTVAQFKANVSPDVIVYAADGTTVAADTAKMNGKMKVKTTSGTVKYDIWVIGDVNDDGELDSADITQVINAMTGKSTDAALIERANVNGDTELDIADISAVVNILIGK